MKIYFDTEFTGLHQNTTIRIRPRSTTLTYNLNLMRGTTPKCKRCLKENIRGFNSTLDGVCWECCDRLKQLEDDIEFLKTNPTK